jgi:hypothetical protein
VVCAVAPAPAVAPAVTPAPRAFITAVTRWITPVMPPASL